MEENRYVEDRETRFVRPGNGRCKTILPFSPQNSAQVSPAEDQNLSFVNENVKDRSRFGVEPYTGGKGDGLGC